METLRRRMEAQKLEAQRTGEVDKMQQRQKLESRRAKEKRAAGGGSRSAGEPALPPPMTPDETPTRTSDDLG